MTDSTTTEQTTPAADRVRVIRTAAEILQADADTWIRPPYNGSPESIDYRTSATTSNMFTLLADHADDLPVNVLAAVIKACETLVESSKDDEGEIVPAPAGEPAF